MGWIADKIRQAILGSDVRDAIADGIEEVESLREDYDAQVINAGNSNAEIVDARGGHTNLKNRLDNADSLMADKAQKFKRPFRFLTLSDIHFDDKQYYGVDGFTRMAKMVDVINEENKKYPLDFVLVLGDISLDYYYRGLSPINYNYTKKVRDYFLAKISVQTYIIPGNHDNYSDEEWGKNISGAKQYSIDCDDYGIIMLDNFKHIENVEYPGADMPYSKVDMVFLTSEMQKFEGRKVILCGHYFDYGNESQEFKDYVQNNNNIIALVCGHSHKHITSTFGNKPLLFSGNFSYGLADGTVNPVYSQEYAYGFREFMISNNGLVSSYIMPEFKIGNINQDYVKSTEDILDISVQAESSPLLKNLKNVPNQIDKNYLDYNLANSIQINNGDDLNNYVEYGTFISQNATISSTLLNCPVSSNGFKLVVERVNGFGYSNTVRQTIYEGNANKYGLTRLIANGVGSEWNEIITRNRQKLKITDLITGFSNTIHTYEDIFNALKDGQEVEFSGDNSDLLPLELKNAYGGQIKCNRLSNTTMVIEVYSKHKDFPITYRRNYSTNYGGDYASRLTKWVKNNKQVQIFNGTPIQTGDIITSFEINSFGNLIIRPDANATFISVPIIGGNNNLRGMGLNAINGTSFDMYSFNGTFNGTTITVSSCYRISFSGSGFTMTPLSVGQIVGI